VDRVRLRWNGAECPIDVRLPTTGKDEIARIGPLACKGVPR
jgi:hypothetical protein